MPPGYDTRQSNFYDKDILYDDDNYIISGQAGTNNYTNSRPSRENMRMNKMPGSKNRLEQFSRTFCDDVNQSGRDKGFVVNHILNRTGQKANPSHGNTSHEDAITQMRMNSMKATQLIYEGKDKNGLFGDNVYKKKLAGTMTKAHQFLTPK